MNPDDLLRAFFGGGMRMGGQRHNFQRRQPQGGQRGQAQEERPQDMIGQFIFVIVMFLAMSSTMFESVTEPSFAFEPQGNFRNMRETDSGVQCVASFQHISIDFLFFLLLGSSARSRHRPLGSDLTRAPR
jgi:hypothetical protein